MSTPLSRRTLLRGAGAALALPWLEAMAPRRAHAEAVAPPLRFAAFYVPNGVRADTWRPDGVGRRFTLSRTLAPLEPWRARVVIPTNLWNARANVGDGHYVKLGGFLTSTQIHQTTGRDLNAGNTSIDQLMAKAVGARTALPSMELSMESVSTGVDVNVSYTRLYGSYLSWRSPTQPAPRETDPRAAFQRLFDRGSADAAARARRKSVLDVVAEDASRLRSRLGAGDRARLDEFQEAVHSIETRLAFEDEHAARAQSAPADLLARQSELGSTLAAHAADPHRAGDHAERTRLMLDVMALAFATDTTRVASLMFGNEVSGRNFAFLDGVTTTHHDASHHDNDASKLEQYERITRWHVEQLAYFLDRLKSFREGECDVLDHSMVLFGGGIRDGNGHDPHDLPLVLAGGGGGSIEGGQHLVSPPDTPLANLHLALLRRMGVELDRFADSTGALPIG
ncbi:MAG: DUF1552 domain-containing protein [Planctomycetes bacterium]|nr:DUF1552 domain-containing protein [Planctomycetota bacterium]MCC6407710.1 DUF1552 domain-containing protein [Planctomycetota bacterium]